MIRLDSYDVVPSENGSFRAVTFKNENENIIAFTIANDGDITVDIDDGTNATDVLEAIEIVLGGRLVIEL